MVASGTERQQSSMKLGTNFWPTFSVKEQMANILGFMSLSTKAAIEDGEANVHFLVP